MRASWGALGGALLIACGCGGGKGGGGAGGAGGGSAGTISVRVAHTFLPSGATVGPALDIYDDMYNNGMQTSPSGKPIIAGLAYGTISSYLKPRFVDGNGTAIRLVALPAGTPASDTTNAWEFWGGTDDGTHPQLTVLLVAETQAQPQNALSALNYSVYVEKGDDGQGNAAPLAPPPPTGQGEFLAGTEPVDNGLSTDDYYLFVDDSCAPPLNGDTNLPGVPLIYWNGLSLYFGLFVASPGSHVLSVAPWDSNATPTCDQVRAVKQGTTTVSVAAGQQVLAFVYGTPPADLHLLTAPIAP